MMELFYENDKNRGLHKTFLKLIEEIGELSEALLLKDRKKIEEEIADVIAWTLSLANLLEIDAEKVTTGKYNRDCPKCQSNPCRCKI